MANRIVGNVYIIDSANGNTAIPWLDGTKIATITFWSSDSTGKLQITGASTADVLFQVTNPVNVPNTVGAYLGGNYFKDVVKILTLTAGTAWVYLL